MFDKDTLIVSYDPAIGEPRGSRKRGEELGAIGKGHCIDCQMCVQVCPTGIDIRDGLQYECINCALCVDACDSIMEKMSYPKGLISYTTLNKLEGGEWTWKRPKLIGYGVALVAMLVLFSSVLYLRVPLALDVLRTRGSLYQEVPGGYIQNVYTLKLINMSDADLTLDVSVTGAADYRLEPAGTAEVPAGEIVSLPVNVLVDPDQLPLQLNEIEFEVTANEAGYSATSDSSFIGPTPL